ncbi:MAG: alpha/beta fold hydrolase [Christensenellales bacterium]
MKKQVKGKRLRILGWALAILLAMFIIAPYLIPVSVSSALAGPLPFDNSALADVNGISFHYRTYQPKDGAMEGKLLLVHGLAGSTFSFEASAPAISEAGYYVVSVDLPGFGYSDRNPAYDHSQANRARDLWQLLSVIERRLPGDLAAQPWHLAGHSMGGGTIAAMAMQQPSRVNSLIMVDAALFETTKGGGFLAIPPLGRWMMAALDHFLLTETRIKPLLTSAYGREPSAAQVSAYLAPLRLPGTARSLLNFVRTSRNENPGKLEGLPVPILAIWGSQDTWVPRSDLDKLTAIRPDTTVRLIEGAAHCPMETHPEVFVDMVLQWLSDNPNAVRTSAR